MAALSIDKAVNEVAKRVVRHVVEGFRDYQIEWLTSHIDIELVPEVEALIVRFLEDTAECFIKEAEEEG